MKDNADIEIGSLRALERKLRDQRIKLHQVRNNMELISMAMFGGEKIDTGTETDIDKRCFTDSMHMLLNQHANDIDELAKIVEMFDHELQTGPELVKVSISAKVPMNKAETRPSSL